MHTNHPAYKLGDYTVQPVGPRCVLRSDRMIGYVPGPAYSKPKDVQDIHWYTLDQIAQRAGVPKPVIVERLKARWSFAELVKPEGWERVVDAKRNGVRTPEGKRIPFAEFCAIIKCSTYCLQYRLAQGWPWETLSAPGRLARTPTTIGEPVSAPDAPPTLSASARVGLATYSYARFEFRGAVDTLLGHCRAQKASLATVRYRLRNGCTLDEAFDPHRKQRSDKGVPSPRRGNRAGSAFPPRADGSADPTDAFDEKPVSA